MVAPERVVRERVPGDPSDPSTLIFDFEGELFFGAAPDLEQYLEALGERIKHENIKYLVVAGQAGASPGCRRHPADREFRARKKPNAG